MKISLLEVKLFFLAFFIRLIVIIFTICYGKLETWEYETLANNMLNGKGYTFLEHGAIHYAYGPPLYPFFSALVYYFTNHNQFLLSLFQAVFSAITSLLILKIGTQVFNYKIGLLASLITILHPGLIIYVTKLHSFNIDILLFASIILVVLKAKNQMIKRNYILLGLLYGLCLLSRSTIALFLPIVYILLILKSEQKKRLTFCFLLAFIISILIVTPWLIRNKLILKRFILQETGETFWRGNNPHAIGTLYTAKGIPLRVPMKEITSEDFLNRLYSLSGIEQDQLFWDEGIKFIKQQPLKFITLSFRRFYYFWWFSPHFGIQYPKVYLTIYRFIYSIIFLFGIIGLIFALNSKITKIKENTSLILLFIIIISFSQSLFYVEGRHRWAIEPLIIILSSYGMRMLFENLVVKPKLLRTKLINQES